jgi:NAD(P)-dependent dehydrogenase (short-subunit alcohol dehydrogenase family)
MDDTTGRSARLSGTVAQVEAMRERIEREAGPVDILIANAGGNPVRPGNLEDLSEADWRAAVDQNLTLTFLTIKSLLPGMKARGSGAIVTMSSAARSCTDRPAPKFFVRISLICSSEAFATISRHRKGPLPPPPRRP